MSLGRNLKKVDGVRTEGEYENGYNAYKGSAMRVLRLAMGRARRPPLSHSAALSDSGRSDKGTPTLVS
jgi:hypothetical protein